MTGVVAPARFRAPIGRICAPVEFTGESSVVIPRGLSAARRVGLKYEEKVRERLREVFPDIRLGVWARYSQRGTHLAGRCQLDALLVDVGEGLATVFEIKARHCLDAWQQLTWLYAPVVECAFRGAVVNRVEVCPMYDPAVVVPEAPELIEDVEMWVRRPQAAWGVWRVRG